MKKKSKASRSAQPAIRRVRTKSAPSAPVSKPKPFAKKGVSTRKSRASKPLSSSILKAVSSIEPTPPAAELPPVTSRKPAKAVALPKKPKATKARPQTLVSPSAPEKAAPLKKTPAKPAAEVARAATPSPVPQVQLPPDFPFRVPSILLEGDEPLSAIRGKAVYQAGRGAEQSSVPAHEIVQIRTSLHLAARDPRCLYASWDLSFEEQHACNSRSADHHLVLRARLGDGSGAIVAEVHVHPESQHWFVHVDQAGTTYAGELGYYTHTGQWISLACSKPVATPSDQPIPTPFRHPADFVRVTPVSGPSMNFVPAPERHGEDGLQPAPAPVPQFSIHSTGPEGTLDLGTVHPQPGDQRYPEISNELAAQFSALPRDRAFIPASPQLRVEPAPQPVWLTAEQEELLETAIVSILRPESIGSLEFVEQLSLKLAAPPAPAETAGAPSSLAPAVEALGISSPGGEAVPQRAPGFWFNVNAELVIYGATEPDARVSIGSRTIRLREDGSFSYRFALPDGQFSLPITAVATHGDMRQTRLSFRRDTEHTGIVGTHPQDPALKPPAPENIA